MSSDTEINELEKRVTALEKDIRVLMGSKESLQNMFKDVLGRLEYVESKPDASIDLRNV